METPSGMTADELAAEYSVHPAYRARQLRRWLDRGASSFDQMTDLPADERRRLSALLPALRSSAVAAALSDDDGSLKLQIRLADGAAVECVLLEDLEGRRTACLSSQVGCPMGCAFCRTGSLGFLRDLSAGEIMEQYHHLGDRTGGTGSISNVVFMGMGEPLANLASLRRAVSILTGGIGMSHRKITISTCGLVPGILELARDGPSVRLAVSLTTADEELRSRLMPVNRSWGLAALKEALVAYQAATGERVTLEAAIMGGVNSSAEQARAIVRWAEGLDVQVNVIPWNKAPGLPFKEPERAEVDAFLALLEGAGLVAVRRMRRGRGVMGACGQLGETLRADLG
jgi:23S rRNA (adenine2503-C2)-methyltransferase